MLSCSPDICLCRYLEGQDTSHMCFGSLTYHFLYAIAFMRDIVSLVLGKISFGLDVSDLTIFTDSASSACTHIYVSIYHGVENAGLIWMTSAAPSDGISALILVNLLLVF